MLNYSHSKLSIFASFFSLSLSLSLFLFLKINIYLIWFKKKEKRYSFLLLARWWWMNNWWRVSHQSVAEPQCFRVAQWNSPNSRSDIIWNERMSLLLSFQDQISVEIKQSAEKRKCQIHCNIDLWLCYITLNRFEKTNLMSIVGETAP